MFCRNLSNFKNIRIDTRCNTEVDLFYQVILYVIFAYDQEFTGYIVDATFFINTHNRLSNIGFRLPFIRYLDNKYTR